MVEQVPRAIRDYGAGEPRPGRRARHERAVPERCAPERRLARSRRCTTSGELLGYVANLAHHVDVGGGAPASIGAFREVFQEGVIIPPVRLVEHGELVEDVFRLSCSPDPLEARDRGGLPCADRGERDRRAQAAGRRRALRARDAARGDGRAARVHGAAGAGRARGAPARRVRGGGRRSTTTATRTSRCGSARGWRSAPTVSRFDTTGSDPQRRAPVNSTYAQTFSACAYALKCLVDPDLPVNDGFYRLVSLHAPAGTVTNCTWPAPVVGGWETQHPTRRRHVPGAARRRFPSGCRRARRR